MSYDVGDPVKIEWTTAVDGVPTNPTSQQVTVTAPDGTTSTPAITTSAAGSHSATVTASQAGTYTYRVVATGTAAGVITGQFTVVTQAALLVSVDEARSHLNDEYGDAAKLAEWCAAATVVVGHKCPAALIALDGDADTHWDKRVTYGMETLVLPQPIRALVSVTAYSGGTPTVYAETDITAAPPTYGYEYSEGAGLLTLSPMPYGSTVRVVYTPGLPEAKQRTARLAALELIRFWFNPAQYGAMTDVSPLARTGGAGTGAVLVAGYLVPNAVAGLLDAVGGHAPMVA